MASAWDGSLGGASGAGSGQSPWQGTAQGGPGAGQAQAGNAGSLGTYVLKPIIGYFSAGGKREGNVAEELA